MKSCLDPAKYCQHFIFGLMFNTKCKSLADQLTLFQPKGRLSPPITSGTPNVFHLPASLTTKLSRKGEGDDRLARAMLEDQHIPSMLKVIVHRLRGEVSLVT